MNKPKEYLMMSGVGFLLCILFLLVVLLPSLSELGMLGLLVLLGCFMGLSPVWLIFALQAFSRVTLCRSGITIGIGKQVRKQYTAAQICTIVDCNDHGKLKTRYLYVSPISSKELEQLGEQGLNKYRFGKEELSFRRGKSDWYDLCLGEGLGQTTDTIRFEYSPEREQLLKALFPDAEFRKGKVRTDHPG